jgi:hypothetical protein
MISLLAATSVVSALMIFATLASDGELVRLGGEVTPDQYVERSVSLVVATAGGALGIVAMALWFALRRGRSMLGRSRGSLLCGIVLIPLSLFAWKVGRSLALGASMAEWPERTGSSAFRCRRSSRLDLCWHFSRCAGAHPCDRPSTARSWDRRLAPALG